jgi:hypothetical protein
VSPGSARYHGACAHSFQVRGHRRVGRCKFSFAFSKAYWTAGRVFHCG